MLLKIYGIISMLSIITGLKTSFDMKKDKEYLKKIINTETGNKIYQGYKSKVKVVISSLIPIYHILKCFINSMYFILNIFKDEDNKETYLKILKQIDDENN